MFAYVKKALSLLAVAAMGILVVSPAVMAQNTSDIAPPSVVSAEATYSTEVEVTFNEPIKLPAEDPEKAFKIEEEFADDLEIEVMEAEMDEDDNTKVILKTAEQTEDAIYKLTVSTDIMDMAGNAVVEDVTDSTSFVASSLKKPADADEKEDDDMKDMEDMDDEEEEKVMGDAEDEDEDLDEEEDKDEMEDMDDEKEDDLEDLLVEDEEEEESRTPPVAKDTTPPEDVTALVAAIKERVGNILKHYILLTWRASLNTAGDLADQKVYTSIDDGKSYYRSQSVGAAATSYEMNNPKEGQKYVFKVTALDQAGNESAGAVTSIRFLPETGMGAGFVLLGSSIMAARFVRRKKNQK